VRQYTPAICRFLIVLNTALNSAVVISAIGLKKRMVALRAHSPHMGRVPLTATGRRDDAASVEGHSKAVQLVTPAACRVAALASARVGEARRKLARPGLPGSRGAVRRRKRMGGRREKAEGIKSLTGEQSATGIGGRPYRSWTGARALAGCRCTAR
jgi:hypothetical protein